MGEFREASKSGIITREQYKIAKARFSGIMYPYIREKFKIKNNHTLIHCITRTVHGYSVIEHFDGDRMIVVETGKNVSEGASADQLAIG
jgi:hypothetical protein